MIKCYFVEVKNIISNLPKSSFQESEIEQLADLILAANGLIRPLILKDAGGEKYTVIEGDLEYHAAVRAKEKNLLQAEEVNAFIIPTNLQKSAIDQIALLVNNKPSNIPISTDINFSIDNLLLALSSTISLQIQPISDQLIDHKKTLDILEKRPTEVHLSIEQLLPVLSSTISQQLQPIVDQIAEHKKS